MCRDAVFNVKETKRKPRGKKNFTFMSKNEDQIDQQIKSNKNDFEMSELHVILRRMVILRF